MRKDVYKKIKKNNITFYIQLNTYNVNNSTLELYQCINDRIKVLYCIKKKYFSFRKLRKYAKKLERVLNYKIQKYDYSI